MTALFYSLTVDILRLDLSSVGPNAGEYDLDYQGKGIIRN